MFRILSTGILTTLLISLPAAAPAAASPVGASACTRLTALTIPTSTIIVATPIVAGTFQPANGPEIAQLPPFCRVALRMSYSADSDVEVEIWLPLSGWNGRYLGTGNGGYAGAIRRTSLAEGLRLGYAVANTDMGTGRETGSEGAPHLIGHPVRWLDFGRRSTHGMTTAAKHIIQAFYGRAPEYSYFKGCSTGGMQGLREAQDYPEDYDGILVGAPGHNRARIHIALLWNYAVAKSSPSRQLTAEKLKLIHRAVISECAAPGTTFVDDPTRCRWRPEVLSCKSSDTSGCLTPDELDAVNMLYAGPRNARTGEQIFPGLPRGTELGWKHYMAAAGKPDMPFAGVFRWVFGPDWQWHTFDYDRDAATFEEVLAPFFVAADPDLSRFKASGGKLIMYHGWADWLSSAYDSIDYYQKVMEQMSTQHAIEGTALRSTREFFRLFLMPGVDHCAGGPGADHFDGLGVLRNWVEKGLAPERIMASSRAESAVRFTRPLCPYPGLGLYKGTGELADASSFECQEPDRKAFFGDLHLHTRLSFDAHLAGVRATAEDAFRYPSVAEANLAARFSSGGLTGVWAEENTREAIFAALGRRETFATSGPRISVRFFAGYDLPRDMANRPDAAQIGYQRGVPMGGELSLRAGQIPSFLVWAMQDGQAARLQRVQIVKVWPEGMIQRERVFDVACADNAPVSSKTYRCPQAASYGAANPMTCEPALSEGAVELRTLWTDPEFDPYQPASYHVRVLEVPTCRWSTRDAVRADVEPNPRLPVLIQ